MRFNEHHCGHKQAYWCHIGGSAIAVGVHVPDAPRIMPRITPRSPIY
jgi:hypothetical protein